MSCVTDLIAFLRVKMILKTKDDWCYVFLLFYTVITIVAYSSYHMFDVSAVLIVV